MKNKNWRKAKHKRRDKRVTVNLTQKEYGMIESKSNKTGLSMSETVLESIDFKSLKSNN